MIDILITHKDRPKLLKELLQSIRAYLHNIDYNIIILDDDSKQPPTEIHFFC